jgi:hypothetical protein
MGRSGGVGVSELRRIAHTIFIFGPALLTLVMVVGCNTLNPGLWIASPIMLGFLALLIWHFALAYTHRDKIGYIVYAVFNLFWYFQMLVGIIGP